MGAVLKILDQEIRLPCAPHEERRLEDLAAALEARLAGTSGDAGALRRLILTSLSLMDEAQAAAAALARARCEIERLTDLVVEARLDAGPPEPANDERGRVGVLRARHGAA